MGSVIECYKLIEKLDLRMLEDVALRLAENTE
jgi:hypothetical protein